jgi:hypothetical protein
MTTIHQSMTKPTTTLPNLGTLLSEHRASQVRLKGNLWSGIVFILLGIITVVVGLIAAMPETSTTFFCGGVGLLSIAGGAWAVLVHRQEQGMAVQLFEDGLVYRQNGRILIMRWADVTDLDAVGVYNSKLHSSFYTYTLKDMLGQTIRLNLTQGYFENADQLAQTIQQEVTTRQLPRAVADYNAGTPLKFGPLTLTQQGIQNGRKFLPWSQVAEATIGRHGYFVLHAHEKTISWARVDMTQISNVFILLSLINWIAKRQV